jgi:hypothetical protein
MFVLADAASDVNAPAAIAALSAMMGSILIVGLGLTVLFVWMFWRVFVKAGFPGAMGLLCLIPSIGPVVCLIILAFATWPSERAGTPVMPGTMPTTM